MASIVVDFTAFPQSVAVDASQLTQLNDGRWRQTYTPTLSSASLASGGNYYCLTAGNDLGGLWMYDDGGTLKVALFENAPGSPIIVEATIVRAAGTAFTALVDNVADSMNLSGAGLTTGAGDHAFTGSTTGDAFGTSPLGGGQYPGGGYTWAGSMSDIDDANDGVTHDRAAVFTGAVDLEAAGRRTLNRAAVVTGAADLEVAGQRTFHRVAAVAAAVTLAISGQVTSTTTHNRAAVVTGAVDLEVAGQRSHNRAAIVAGAADLEVSAQRTFHRIIDVAGAVNLEIAGQIAGAGLSLGGYGAQRVLYGTAAGTVSVTITTAASGSTFLLAVGGNLSDLATAPTDTESNTWTQVGSFEFTQWAGYGCVYYQAVNGTGAGGSHTFSQQFGQTLGFDECTIAVVEIKNAVHVEDSAVTETASGSTVSTPAVVSQDACEWVVFSTGDAPTGSTAAYTPSNGLTVIHDATGVDHANGYVPIVILHASKTAAGSYSSSIGISPAQRLGLGVFAVQAANVIGRSATFAGAVNLEAAGQVTRNRAAAVAGAVDLQIAGSATHQRASAVTGAADLEIAGVPTRNRAAVVSAAVDLEVLGQVTRQRTAAFTAAADLEVAGVATHHRAAAFTGAVDLEIAGLALPPGATQHNRAIDVTAAAALAVVGQVTRARTALVTGAAALAISGQRTHNRAAAVSGAVGLEVAGRAGSLSRLTTIAAVRDAIIERIVGLTPGIDAAYRWVVHDDAEELRDWAVRAPSAAYRRFSVEPQYTTEAPVVSSVNVEQVMTTFEVVVAYPLSGRWNNRRGLFDVIDSDRRRLEYEVGTASRSGAGFDAPATLISRGLPAPEEAEGVVFASLLIDATYWRTHP